MYVNYQKVMEKMGWVAEDTTDYERVNQTWNFELSGRNCPLPSFFYNIWIDMVMSGEETGDWRQERQKAYQNQSVHIEKINDLIMEYNLAIVNGDTTTANKYKTELSALQDKRQAIKQQFPKQ